MSIDKDKIRRRFDRYKSLLIWLVVFAIILFVRLILMIKYDTDIQVNIHV